MFITPEYLFSGAAAITPEFLARARKKFGVPRRQMAIVGDQLFTDRLAGTLYGIPALVVQPMYEDFKKGIRFKRRLEKPFLARYFKKGGKLL
ncbi:HAD hydrolase-like protein [Fournierella sp.]|uniref:HAD hydrolase-like protein n=1 Tax=Allofournierella sp. TaxID=1940256 RepID=UPI0025BFE572|nr:HAD hydrolase-like protein [Fournierella sp.]